MRKFLALLFAMTATSVASAADAPAPTEGKDYSPVLQASAANTDAQHVTVEEFFWYGCPHCYKLESSLEAWVAKLPKYVTFVRVPNSLGRDVGVLHSKTFYAAQSMNILDKMHKPVFDALHENPGSLVTVEAMAEFAHKVAGVPASAFAEQLNSFFVDSQVRRAEQEARDYGITGTPTLVVDGRWLVPAKEPPESGLKVADFVIEKVRKEKNLSDAPVKKPKGKKKKAAP